VALPALIAAVAWSAAACTQPNPYFGVETDGSATNCAPGERRCLKQTTQICGGGQSYINERLCPGGSSCSDGICVPGGAACTTACAGKQVCTLFVDPVDGTSLGSFCADPLGQAEGARGCKSNTDCRSGFCITRMSLSFCYQPCLTRKDCQSDRCLAVVMTVNGVQDSVKSCVP